MRRIIVALALTVVMVLGGASAALAGPAHGKDGAGKCFGQAVAAANSSGARSHQGYAGGLPAALDAHGSFCA